jgi:hypothetical protein
MLVPIAGLPEAWQASVCPHTGGIVFEHLPTGTKQSQVPPGFADATAATGSGISISGKGSGIRGGTSALPLDRGLPDDFFGLDGNGNGNGNGDEEGFGEEEDYDGDEEKNQGNEFAAGTAGFRFNAPFPLLPDEEEQEMDEDEAKDL